MSYYIGGHRVLTRAELGLRPPRSQRKLTGYVGNVAHHTTGKQLGADLNDDWWRNIQNFHMDTQGWADIGYNFGICSDGTIFEGRGFGIRGAHAGKVTTGVVARNSNTHGFALLGDGSQVFNESIASAYLALHLAAGGGKMWGHRDLKATACPGNKIEAWIKAGMPLSTQPEEVVMLAYDHEQLRIHLGNPEDDRAKKAKAEIAAVCSKYGKACIAAATQPDSWMEWDGKKI